MPKTISLNAIDGDGDVLTYSIVAAPTHGTLSGGGATVTYTSQGSFVGTDTFVFRANDGLLNSNSATVTINVANASPAVTAAATPLSITVGESAAFTAVGSDPDGDALTYAWDFGDGTTGTGANTSHAYAQPGSYLAKVTATDPFGASATATVVVVVGRPPRARFTTGDVVGFVGIPMTFDASLSTDPENAIVAYSWNFGDASPAGATQIISKEYGQSGRFTVTLTITDKEGLKSSLSRVIEILPADQIGLFNSFINYKVRWDRNKENTDSMNLEANVNVGDAVVQDGTVMALEMAGQRFEGSLNGKLQSKSANLTWQVVANTRKQSAGEVFVRVKIRKASLGLGFNLAGAVAAGDDGDPVVVDIPVRLEIAGRVFEVPIESEFKFSKDGKKANGEGEGP